MTSRARGWTVVDPPDAHRKQTVGMGETGTGCCSARSKEEAKHR